jgi:predicted nuclease of restriction endonuclease-like RecB superfamily
VKKESTVSYYKKRWELHSTTTLYKVVENISYNDTSIDSMYRTGYIWDWNKSKWLGCWRDPEYIKREFDKLTEAEAMLELL